MKKSVRDAAVAGKRVLLRVDFNVPMHDGQIVDDARIKASLPTIHYLIEQGARVILLSHLGRPNGYVVEELRMNPVAARLADLIRLPVTKLDSCIGPEVQEAVKAMSPGQLVFLENVRFHPGETVNDTHFAAQLASLADILVNDAFSSAHRILASTVGITRYLAAVAGLHMQSELNGLRSIQLKVHPPLVILLGGIRLAEKSHFIDDNLERKNRILFGGVLANTFLKAKGLETGQSRVETQVLTLCREFFAGSHYHLDLPVDLVVADALSDHARRKVVAANRVPQAMYIVDIGPATTDRYSQILAGAGTVIWNGPMGLPALSKATETLARKIAGLENTVKIAGGGDTLLTLDRLGLTGKFDYLSTGGAAFLDALGSEPLPAVKVLQDKEEHPVTETPDTGNPGV